MVLSCDIEATRRVEACAVASDAEVGDDVQVRDSRYLGVELRVGSRGHGSAHIGLSLYSMLLRYLRIDANW